MPQISLYVDSDTLSKIEQCARMENKSISKWVTTRLKESLTNKWPENYPTLFGCIDDDTFTEDAIKDFSKDMERETL